MLSKTKRPYDPEALPPDKRLRANVQDLFANNLLSGKRLQELINDAAGAGASSMGCLSRKDDKNATRHLRSKFLKRNQWPDVYWARVRVKDKKHRPRIHNSVPSCCRTSSWKSCTAWAIEECCMPPTVSTPSRKSTCLRCKLLTASLSWHLVYGEMVCRAIGTEQKV